MLVDTTRINLHQLCRTALTPKRALSTMVDKWSGTRTSICAKSDPRVASGTYVCATAVFACPELERFQLGDPNSGQAVYSSESLQGAAVRMERASQTLIQTAARIQGSSYDG
jgi:hypothetical protein